jgi:acetylornithine deacetylase/succinyl-diaminopimelate desuccinylase-like protein
MLGFARSMAGYLYRAKRNAARAALYLSLVLSGLLASLIFQVLRLPGTGYVVNMGWSPDVDYEALEEVQLFQSFLRIDTTLATGDELKAARFLAEKLEAEGIDSEILLLGENNANLIATIEGASDDALILHNHLDIEPILLPDRWEHDPFSGEIDLPWIYGRGAFDMKSVTIAQMMAMIELKRSGVVPERDVIFLATSSEEVGSELGSLWLLEERLDLFRNAWALISEGGVVEARTPTDVKYWGTEVGQKKYVKILACSPSRQRLEDLRSDILGKDEIFNRLRLLPEIERFLGHYAPTRDLPALKTVLSHPEQAFDDPERFHELAPYQRALFRDEIWAFPVAESADGTGYQLHISVALLPDGQLENALQDLLPPWMTHGLNLVVQPDQGSSAISDLDHPVLAAIAANLTDRLGEITIGPYYQMRSATDARFFREHGVPSYGFSPFLVLSTDTIGIGGPNEGIALPGFVLGVEIYTDLLSTLVSRQ